MSVRFPARRPEVSTLTLPEHEIPARTECPSDQSNLIDNEEHHRTPLLLQASCFLSLEFLLPGPIARDAEAGTRCLRPEADIERSDARIRSQLNARVDTLSSGSGAGYAALQL